MSTRRNYYTKRGLEGLGGRGIATLFITFVGVSVVARVLRWLYLWFKYRSEMNNDLVLFAHPELKTGSITAFGIITGAIVTAFVYFLLPRQTFYEDETDYYCAKCQQFLGTTPRRCDRCGSNRYTTRDKLSD